MIEENKDYNTQQEVLSIEKFLTNIQALRSKYRVRETLSPEVSGDSHIRRILKDNNTERNPSIPSIPKAAFKLFKDYYSAIQLELQKEQFELKYRSWNEASIVSELKLIEEWINDAANLDYSLCVLNNVGVIQNAFSDKHEFLRLRNGFYDNYLMTWEQQNEMSIAAIVYGRYFFFYDFLKNILEMFKQENPLRKGEDFIKPELVNRLLEVEKTLQDLISLWGQGQNKIQCAAFVELLMDKGYFDTSFKTENLKNCELFARKRYNAEIKNQMLPKEKDNRKKHKSLLEKYFK